MGSSFKTNGLTWPSLGTIAMTISLIASTYGSDQSPSLKRLIDESTNKNAIDESTLLNENPLTAAVIPEALRYIKQHPDFTSYHLLVAVKRYYPASYKEVAVEDKIEVLCSALKNSKSLNDWGYLTRTQSYDAESASALLETGKPALKSLSTILNDDSRAPLFGSEEATMSRTYQYRRKDFAYRYISLILGETPAFREDPKERDKDIEALRAKLKKNEK